MERDSNKPQRRRVLATFLLFVFGLTISAPLLFGNARPAMAQNVDPITSVQTTVTNIWDTLKDNIVEGAVTALVNAANYFLSKLAYQLAVSLTSECPGQSVCWSSEGWDTFLEDTGKGAIGEFVGTLSEEGGFSELGLNLCEPSAMTSMTIQLGALDEAEPPGEPSCSFNALTENWSSFAETMTSEEALDSFVPAFEPGESSLSVSLKILDKTTTVEADEYKTAGMKRLGEAMAGGGFSDIVDPVSGRVLAPGATTKKAFDQMEKEKNEDPKGYSRSAAAGQIASKAALSVAMNVGMTFAQTVIARLWNKFTEGLISSEEAITAQPDLVITAEGIFRPPGRSIASKALTRMVVTPMREVGQIDPLAQFTLCPEQGRRPDNCVMDAQFANAVRSSSAALPLTVRDALDAGYLHGDWPLISSNDQAKDQDPYCYTFGYCESNLKKLRAARVIPIGWEIAASTVPPGASSVRLGDVVAGFNDCNEEGGRDDDHPFCRLIDPDWVLKAPPMQCRVEGYGPQPVASTVDLRARQCVDAKTCIGQDDMGNCTDGWGYCVREKNVWRFNGDQCPAEFNSCRTLTPLDGGQPVNFLRNTIDYGVCNADNVGCARYAVSLNAATCLVEDICDEEDGCDVSCTVMEGSQSCALAGGGNCVTYADCGSPSGCDVGCTIDSGFVSCDTVTGMEDDKADDWLTIPARFFNAKAETCNAGDNGCSSLIQLGPRQSLNMVKNGGFETLVDSNSDGSLDRPQVGWLRPSGFVPVGANGHIALDQDLAAEGRYSVFLENDAGSVFGECTATTCERENGCQCTGAGGYSCLVPKGFSSCNFENRVLTAPIPFRSGKIHTVSAVFANPDTSDGAETSASWRVRFYDADGNEVDSGEVTTLSTFSEYIEGYDTYLAGSTEPCAKNGLGIRMSFSYDPDGDELRAACSFNASNEEIAFATVEFQGDGVHMDAVQFEEGPLTPYHSGLNASSRVSLKVPPAYLECTGETGDREECLAFARMCRETEVGCELYTPTSGDPPVPGIVSELDRCPAECAGYDMFFQEETDFEAAPDEPDYFVPSTGLQCTAADVGCTAFTNVDTEQVEYFSRLRICERPDSENVQVFYTWEGSDAGGFQLKSWNLRRSAAPIVEGDHDFCADEGCPTTGNTGYGPCIDLQQGSPNLCTPEASVPADHYGRCTPDDIAAGDFDCREFYDSDGNRHYRRLSRTVIASEDCSRYRLAGRTQEDCEKWDGDYSASLGECFYTASPSWSSSCGAASAGCRAYRGNAAANVRTVLVSDFEDGLQGWETSGWDDGLVHSAESVVVGGHSLGVLVPFRAQVEVGQFMDPAALYSVSFWARGTGSLSVSLEPGSNMRTCDLECPADALYDCTCLHETGVSCSVAPGEGSCTIDPVEDFRETCTLTAACDNPGGCRCEIPDPATGMMRNVCDVAQGNVDCSAPAFFASGLTLDSDWTEYEFGPVRVGDMEGLGDGSVVLRFDPDTEVYIDNVILKRVRDSIYVVRGSWVTPASCDRTVYGVYSPLEMLGCREYDERDGGLTYLRSFSSLCRDVAVGCEAFEHTQNNDESGYMTYGAVCRLATGTCETSPSCSCNYVAPDPDGGALDQEVFSNVCRVPVGESECRFDLKGIDVMGDADTYPDRFLVPADERVYLVDDGSARCSAANVGCRSFGVAQIEFERRCVNTVDGEATDCVPDDPDALSCECTDEATGLSCDVRAGEKYCMLSLEDGDIASWRATAVKDLPSSYDRTLCLAEAVGCRAYTATDGTYYFKDPGTQTCVFRENASVTGGGEASGWFRKSSSGSFFPCYAELLEQGASYGIYKNADPSCALPDEDGDGLPDRCNEDSGCLCTETMLVGGEVTEVPLCNVRRGNSRCGYSGWVGECPAEFDMCEEFIDPMDTSDSNPDGEPYYYILNSKLDDSSCSGQASLKRGCVLLDQTSNTDSYYSTAATYYRSNIEANGGLVNTVNCDNPSTRHPSCNRRCFSIREGHCSTSERACYQDADCPADEGECIGTPTWTDGCRSDDDCSANVGELCLEPDDLTLLGNDTNVVLKVRPDRECAEWLECRQSTPVYDEGESKWRSVCNSFALCDKNEQIGENFFCTNFKTVKKEVMSVEDYVLRDISWRGLEYSGYSLVDRYPPQYLLPVKITQGRCMDRNNDEIFVGGTVHRCDDTAQCNGEIPEGSGGIAAGEADPTNFCSSPMGGVCVGGDDASMACDDDGHCRSGWCSKSHFSVLRFGVQRSLCRNAPDGRVIPCERDEQCDFTEFGIDNGSCATSCSSAGGPDESCPSDGFGEGACFEHACFYDFEGGTLRPDEAMNAPACRAFPEEDSPFPETVLYGSTDISDNGYDIYGEPYVYKQSFRKANVCMESNDCDCNYRRLDYGSNGGMVRFHSIDSPRTLQYDGSGNTYEEGNWEWVSGTQSGVCQGGPYEGASCNPIDEGRVRRDEDTGEQTYVSDICAKDQGGRCVPLSAMSYVMGWPGFCVDADYSRLINGTQDRYGCNLWLPVDQLSGLPDNWNQFREAGFNPPQGQLNYCQVAEGNGTKGVCETSLSPGSTMLGICSDDEDCEAGGLGKCIRYVAALKPISEDRNVNDDDGYNVFPCVSTLNCSTKHFSQTSCDTEANGLYIGTTYSEQFYPSCAEDTGPCTDNQCEGTGALCDTVRTRESSPVAGTTCYWNSEYNICYDKLRSESSSCTAYSEEERSAWYDACIIAGVFAALDPSGSSAALAIICAAVGPFRMTANLCDGLDKDGTGDSTFGMYQCSGNYGPAQYRTWFQTKGSGLARKYEVPASLGYMHSQAYDLQKPNMAGIQIVTDAKFATNEDASSQVKTIVLSANNNWENAIAWNSSGSGPAVVPSDPTSENQRFMPGLDDGASTEETNCLALLDAADSTALRNGCSSINNRCIAVRANFDDTTGRFLGLTTLACAGDTSSNMHIPVRWAAAYMRENCLEIAKVYDENRGLGAVLGVPYTDRLYQLELGDNPDYEPPERWQNHVYSYSGAADYYEYLVGGVSAPNIGQLTNTDMSPYGAITDGFSGDARPQRLIPVIGDRGNDEHSGSPYADFALVPGQAYVPVSSIPFGAVSAPTMAGYPLACIGPCRSPSAVAGTVSNQGGSASGIGLQRIHDLFASIFMNYFETDEGNPYETERGADDRLGTADIDGTAPQVRPVAIDFCREEGKCHEVQNQLGMTVNGKYEDHVVEGGGSLVNTVIQYFAFADKDHLPLRRKIIDFGDGTEPVESTGFYKNHRGLLYDGEPNGIADSVLPDTPAFGAEYIEQCTLDTEWGLTASSCDSRYFQELKTYICNEGILTDLTECTGPWGDSRFYPCQRDGACVFKPRVQFLDNWGICNGTCPDGDIDLGGDICINSEHPDNNYLDEAADYDIPGNECSTLNDARWNSESKRWYREPDDWPGAVEWRMPWTEFPCEIVLYPGSPGAVSSCNP